MECMLCGSNKFRLSKLHPPDLLLLIRFQYPVRCKACHKRATAGFLTAMKVNREDKLRREKKRRREAEDASTARQA
jgi:hypothetical protein